MYIFVWKTEVEYFY